MAYQALYRKYRPIDFDDVVGQDAIVDTLKNTLKLGKTSHAYMFFGPRGIGKTTIAKILAKSLNCLDYQDDHCCGKCKNCLAISSNSTADIIEIDAASNNGVDEIREIRNKINLVPSELNYKVYIIDEVHMLSIGAFNALLKTLEEPPSHVVFILATTDPHKVPTTIVSRCQCFGFKRIADDVIMDRLKNICNIENIDINDDVLKRIAHLSDGGMRDSLSMLDRISSYTNEKITLDKFNEINNLVDDDYKISFLSSVKSNDIVNILNSIEDIYSKGKDIIIFSQDLMEFLRDDMVNAFISKKSKFPTNFSISMIEFLNKLLVNLKSASNIKIMFETSILSYISKNDNDNKIGELPNINNDKNVINKPSNMENVAINDKNSVVEKDISNSSGNKNIGDYEKIKSTIINNTFATAQKKLLIELKKKWNDFNDYVFDTYYGSIASFMLDTTLRAAGNDDLIVTYNFSSGIERGIENIDKVRSLLEKTLNKSYNVALITESEWNIEKNKFIESKNNGLNYKYITLVNEKNSNESSENLENNVIIENDIVDQAINLFGEDIVKIDN